MDSRQGKDRGILKSDSRQRAAPAAADARAELTPQGSWERAPASPQPSVDRLSVTWAEPDTSMASSGVNLFHLPTETAVNNEIQFANNAADGSEDEDYSVSLSAVLRQRRASVRRSKKGRRRPSSPFLAEEPWLRRRPSVFTTSSGDTAITVDEDQNEEVTQEQIFENIYVHKEVLSSVKQQPFGMRRKLKIVHQAKAYIKKHEGQLQERLAQSKSTKDILASFNILMTAKWQQLKREAANMSNLLIPWELRIKEIESHFGSVVASYFTFLRWLFWVNLVIGSILMMFVIVPEYLTANPQQDGERKIIMDEEMRNATNLLKLWEFEGVLKCSPIFYGYYTNIERPEYRMPLAYFLTGLVVYIYSFVATLRKMAENSRMSKLSEKEDECIFSWKLFTGWDYMIGNAETAHNRIASVILSFKEALLEEAEKKKDLRNWRVISLRALVSLCVLILLAVSAYAVVTVVSRSDGTPNNASRNWWTDNETTIVVTVISITFPYFFELLGYLERYHPRKQLRLQLARIMLLNLLNLYSLIFALFSKIEGMSKELDALQPQAIQLNINATIVSDTTLDTAQAFTASVPSVCEFIEERVECTSPDVKLFFQDDIQYNLYSTTPGSITTMASIYDMNTKLTNKPSRKSKLKRTDNEYLSPLTKLEVVNNNNNMYTTDLNNALHNELIRLRMLDALTSTNSSETSSEEEYVEEYENNTTENSSLSLDYFKEVMTGFSVENATIEDVEVATKGYNVLFTEDFTLSTESTVEYDKSLSYSPEMVNSTNTTMPLNDYDENLSDSFEIINSTNTATSFNEYDYETTIQPGIKNTLNHLDENLEYSPSAGFTTEVTSESSQLPETKTDEHLTDDEQKNIISTARTFFYTDNKSNSDETPDINKWTINPFYTQSATTSSLASCPTITFNSTNICSGLKATNIYSIINCTKVEIVCYVTRCKIINNTENLPTKFQTGNTVKDIAYIDENNRKMYNLTKETKWKLLKLCWETMFGQELVKLTMMDLVFVLLGTLFMDFFRALFVRFLNRIWCWDLEKTYPEYGDFKIAENILHLINNQGMVWMGMFFSPGLVVLNVFKLVILMYLRSWAVMTCNVPHEVVFRVSKSNNFYLALLLTMLFLCVLPVGYSIVWVKPSWHCGPFSEYEKIYYILTKNIYKILPSSLNFALEYIASPAIVIPLLVLLILIIYYLTSLTNSLREANNDLKIQLRRERTEERRKMFQMADRNSRPGASALDNTPFARWKRALPSLQISKTDSDDRKATGNEDKGSKLRGSIFAKIVSKALDFKSDVEAATEMENNLSTSGNADEETDTDFHEILPKELLKKKDIVIEKIKSKPRDKNTEITQKQTELGLPKSIIEDSEGITGLRKTNDKKIKLNREQTSESSTQSKQSDSISSVIPLITISATESDDDLLQGKERKSNRNVIAPSSVPTDKNTQQDSSSSKKNGGESKSLRRQSSVDSGKVRKTKKEKPSEGHKYQYSL